jgi:hypothetical protein
LQGESPNGWAQSERLRALRWRAAIQLGRFQPEIFAVATGEQLTGLVSTAGSGGRVLRPGSSIRTHGNPIFVPRLFGLWADGCVFIFFTSFWRFFARHRDTGHWAPHIMFGAWTEMVTTFANIADIVMIAGQLFLLPHH